MSNEVAVTKPAEQETSLPTKKIVNEQAIEKYTGGFSVNNLLSDPTAFNNAGRMAGAFARSKMTPDAYRNDVDACFVALCLSNDLQVNPLHFMQNTYLIKGKVGYEAKFVISLLNKSGIYPDGLVYEIAGEGMNKTCICSGVTKSGKVETAEFSMQMAKLEGLIDKPGSKWKNLPDLMLRYRSASFLINIYHPEIKMGGMFVDEITEMHDTDKIDEVKAQSMTEKLKSAAAEDAEDEPESSELTEQEKQEISQSEGV